MTDLTEQVVVAAQAGDIGALRALAQEHGRDAVRADDDPEELTALHWAAAAGNEDVVRWLLSEEIGADAKALRGNNFSALHGAAMHGHVQICRLLLEQGADPDVQTDPQGYAPMHSAAWGGHLRVVRMLMQHGARTDLPNYRAETPLETARRQEQAAVVQVLEGTQSSPQARDHWETDRAAVSFGCGDSIRA